MAYNEITVGDKTVQGHRYVEGRVTVLSNQINAGTYTYTATEDCLVHIFATGTASSSNLRLDSYVNDENTIDCVTGQAGLYCFNIQLPVRKGDIVKLVSTISSCWLYISVVKYQ